MGMARERAENEAELARVLKKVRDTEDEIMKLKIREKAAIFHLRKYEKQINRCETALQL